MRNIFLLSFLILSLNMKALSQNIEIDTIKNVSKYAEYVKLSDSLIRLIYEGQISKVLNIYNNRGNFFQNNKHIKKNLEDFHKLINYKGRKMAITKSDLILPRAGSIPSQSLELLSIFYNFPSKYKGLYNQIEIDYPLEEKNKRYQFDMLFYRASQEYEARKKIKSIRIPQK